MPATTTAQTTNTIGVEDGNIDYNWFAETLKKIGYDKNVVVESMHKVPRAFRN